MPGAVKQFAAEPDAAAAEQNPAVAVEAEPVIANHSAHLANYPCLSVSTRMFLKVAVCLRMLVNKLL